jgi:acetylglutamate kinase
VKLVIQISGNGAEHEPALRQFAKVVSQLVSEGHRITVVFSRGNASQTNSAVHKCLYCAQKNQLNGNGAEAALKGEMHNATLPLLTERASAPLVALLSGVGLAAFGLCGADGHIMRIRKLHSHALDAWEAEVTSVNPFWLDTISNNKGVLVIENAGLGADQNCYALDPDQMAGAFAIGWNADALIFLTTAEGLTNADGSVVRWLEAERLVELTKRSAIAQDMLPKLQACRHALKSGVRRARVLPVSQVDSLAMFYVSRIECGTEVVEAAGKTAFA